jgi:phage shock protein C
MNEMPHTEPNPSQPGPAQPPYRPLRRVRDDRIIAGVCAGIGRYFKVDPTAVRVAFALIAALTWGAALLAYPIIWFLMPEEPAPQWPTTTQAGPPVTPPPAT